MASNHPNRSGFETAFLLHGSRIFYAKEHFNTERDFKDSYLLFYTIDGCGIIQQNDVTIRLLPDMVLLINCRSPQSYRTDQDIGHWSHYWVHFDGEGMKGLEDLLILNQKNSAVLLHSAELKGQFDQILKNLENTSSATVLEDSLLIHQILTGMILRPEEPVSHNQKQALYSAALYRTYFT